MKKKNPLTSVLLRTNTSESLSMVCTFTFAMSARLKRTYAHAVFTNATDRTCICESRIPLDTCCSLDKGSMSSGFLFSLHNQMDAVL